MRRNSIRRPIKEITRHDADAGKMTWSDILVESSEEQIFAFIIKEQTELIKRVEKTTDKDCPFELRSGLLIYNTLDNKRIPVVIAGVKIFGSITVLAINAEELNMETIERIYENTALVMVGDSRKVERIVKLGTQKDLYKKAYAAFVVYATYPWKEQEFMQVLMSHNKSVDPLSMWNAMGESIE